MRTRRAVGVRLCARSSLFHLDGVRLDYRHHTRSRDRILDSQSFRYASRDACTPPTPTSDQSWRSMLTAGCRRLASTAHLPRVKESQSRTSRGTVFTMSSRRWNGLLNAGYWPILQRLNMRFQSSLLRLEWFLLFLLASRCSQRNGPITAMGATGRTREMRKPAHDVR